MGHNVPDKIGLAHPTLFLFPAEAPSIERIGVNTDLGLAKIELCFKFEVARLLESPLHSVMKTGGKSPLRLDIAARVEF